jgi:hypothetical protein
VNVAPALRQDKNGFDERHWQTLVAMDWNWLVWITRPNQVLGYYLVV